LFIRVFRTKSASIVQNYNYLVVYQSISNKICLYRAELQLLGCLSEYFGQNLPLSFRITTTWVFVVKQQTDLSLSLMRCMVV